MIVKTNLEDWLTMFNWLRYLHVIKFVPISIFYMYKVIVSFNMLCEFMKYGIRRHMNRPNSAWLKSLKWLSIKQHVASYFL